MRGTEQMSTAVILQVSENTIGYHGGVGPITRASCEIAAAARVPVAVHLDHATTAARCQEAAKLGFDSVMFDASSLSFDENVESTRRVADQAHAAGIMIEAELGIVGGKAGGPAGGALTDPDEAARFVELTGVDALAVAVGTSHHMTVSDVHLDLERIRELRSAVAVPLVLHGSSGVATPT